MTRKKFTLLATFLVVLATWLAIVAVVAFASSPMQSGMTSVQKMFDVLPRLKTVGFPE